MSRFWICVALTLTACVRLISCHSWIACSDYAEKNAAEWDANKCRGFARDSPTYAQKNNFGLDRGFDHQPGSGVACKTALTGQSYSAEYPKAVYFPGQQVILAHPMKNHGADAGCTNVYIPDNGNAVYRGRQGAGVDTMETVAYYKQFLVADLGTSPTGAANSQSSTYPKPGYQNAPHFCQNTDKSLGTYSFNVPVDLAPGYYTFVWRWAFNSPSDLYTTCFDVEITTNRAARDSILQARGVANLDVPCGGLTSDWSVQGSNIGCGSGTNTGTSTTAAPPPPPPPTTTTTTAGATTTTTAVPTNRLPMNLFQMTGVIPLGTPANGVTRRFFSVHFDCLNVEASFFNARLIRSHNHENGIRKKRHLATHYDLMQEGSEQLSSEKIFFTVTFPDSCDIVVNPPVATFVSEE